MAAKVDLQRGAAGSGAAPRERPELAKAKAKALARLAEIDLELNGTNGKGWQEHKASGLRRLKLMAERDVLVTRLRISAKGTALEKASERALVAIQGQVARDMKAKPNDANGAVDRFFEQAVMSTLEAGVGLGAVAGRLAQLDGLSAAEHGFFHPVHSAEILGKGVVRQVKDVYRDNGLAAAAGDVASLAFVADLDAGLAGEAFEVAQKMTARLPDAIARGVARTTGISADAALPVAKHAVNVLVAGEVVKESVKVVGLSAAAEKVGADVEDQTRKRKA